MSIINADFSKSTNMRPNHPASMGRRPKDIYSLDLIDLVRRKFWGILFFVLAGIALSVLYYLKAPKTYESRAKLFVDEKSASAIVGDPTSLAAETSVEKYMQTLKSTLILSPAIENGEFHELKSFEEANDILYKLREGRAFSVSYADPSFDSGVIKLSYRGPDPEECQHIVGSIVESFDQHIQATTKTIGGENADLIRRAQEDWLARLKVVEEEIEALMVRPELLNVDGRIINPYQMQLSLMHQDLHELRSEVNKIEARVENVREDQEAGRSSDDLIGDIMSENSDVSDSAYARTQDQLVQLKIEEQGLLNEFAEDHPKLRAIRRQISIVEDIRMRELTSLQRGTRENAGKSEGAAATSIVDQFLQMMERKVGMLKSEERQVEKQIVKLQEKSTSVSALVEQLNTRQRERERLEAGYAALVERMSEMNALKEHLWRNLAVLDPPSIGEAVAPKLSTSLLLGLFLGSLSGLGFACIKEIAEKTFHSSDAVGDALNSRVIGHISRFEKLRPNKLNPKFSLVRPELMTIHAPASQISESYRAVRTSVFFKASETGAKIIQITSPSAGDGKSTTTANLAASIAQAGSRVLLVDADLRKPTQHKLFGVSNDLGMSSIINGEAKLEECVQQIIPNFLSVLTAGPIPANPAELLTSAKFAAVLEEYASEFDFVLVDSPPVLAVTDPSIICGHVDLIYMVMRIRNGVRTNAMRSKEIIESMGMELSGVVINGIRRRDQKGYSYSGQYGYGTNAYGQTAKVSRELSKAGSRR